MEDLLNRANNLHRLLDMFEWNTILMEAGLIPGGNDVKRERIHIPVSFVRRRNHLFDVVTLIFYKLSSPQRIRIVILEK